MIALITKPKDMTEFQWGIYRDLRDGRFHNTKYHGGSWNGSPWDIWVPQVRRSCNILVRKGYFTVDAAMYYHISEPLQRSDKMEAET